YGTVYRRLAAAPPGPEVWDAENAARVAAAVGPPASAPVLGLRARWRDRRLMALAQHKRGQSTTGSSIVQPGNLPRRTARRCVPRACLATSCTWARIVQETVIPDEGLDAHVRIPAFARSRRRRPADQRHGE